MAQIKVHGFDENHKAIVTRKTTPVLITELIGTFPKMCEAEVTHALEEIRKSSEQDERIRKIYASIMKAEKKYKEIDAMDLDEEKGHEDKIIKDGIKAVKKCIAFHNDVDTALSILRLCKALAGDRFEVKLVDDDE